MRRQESIYSLNYDSPSTIDFIAWTGVVCKTPSNTFERMKMIAYFYAVTNNNDFVLWDIGQDGEKLEVSK